MRKIYYTFLLFFNCLMGIQAQSVSINNITDQTARSLQLLGKIDPSISFTVRPISYDQVSTNGNPFKLIDSTDSDIYSRPFHFFNKKGKIGFLPFSLTQQFNSHHPYGWNDGAMISAKGYQSLMTGGFYASLGPLELKCQPEFLYANNSVYEHYNDYGTNELKSYSKLFSGQSSLSLTVKNLSAGISSENLWWGPGINSSLLMSNNALGFGHIFFKTKKPISTPIGSFEWQLIVGKITSDNRLPYENKHLDTAQLVNDWRYLSGLVISYQPKWVQGLFLGFTRAIQQYRNDINIGSPGFLEKFFPVIALSVEKKNVTNEEDKRRDQLASFFIRWVQAKANMEFYIEYGFNDYGINIRDYLMSPTHSAAYIAGIKKILPLRKPLSRVELGYEITHMTQSPDYLVRNAKNWYEHGQIFQGYTNNNQILGAGAGFGANVQSINATFVSGWKQLGILLEMVERDPLNHANHWVDMGIGFLPQYKHKNYVFSGKFQFINSSNYSWQKDMNRFNFHSRLSIQYLF